MSDLSRFTFQVSRARGHLLALALFALLELAFTWPQVCVLSSALRASGPAAHEDALLNTWILAWDVHALLHHPTQFFDANIYHPRQNTLAYSHHLLGVLPIAGPVILLTRNPVLAHNVAVMLSFVLAAWGAYLLVSHLVAVWDDEVRNAECVVRNGPIRNPKSEIQNGPSSVRPAAVLAGVFYAFCPFRMSHYPHVQFLVGTQWLPFALLFLERWLAGRGWRDFALALLFSCLMALSSLYLALLGGFFVLLFLLVRLLIGPRSPRSEIWNLKSGIAALLAWAAFCLLLAAFLVPFHMPYLRFQRELGFERDPRDIVEGSADLCDYLAVGETNKLYGSILPRPSSSECELFPGLVAVVCAAVAVWRLRGSKLILVYGLCALAAFVLSMGPTLKLWGCETLPGPYRLLGLFLPGYSGVRIPARFGIFFQLMLSVLAGLGVARLTRGPHLVPLMAILVTLVEFFAAPVPLAHVPVGKDMPEVYRWLARQPGDAAIVEIPYGVTRLDAFYMYASTTHWKKLVNGASGYDPPERAALRLLINDFPSRDSLEALRLLGVDYVVFHQDLAGKRLGELPPGLRLEAVSGGAAVVKVLKEAPGVAEPTPLAGISKRSPSAGKATASHAPEIARLAMDGNSATSWTSGVSQTEGMWFQLDFGEPRQLARIRFRLGCHAGDFPRQFKVDGSLDAHKWEPLAEGRPWLQVLKTCFAEPKNPSFEIAFPVTRCRFLRITQTAKRFDYCWSIAEVGVSNQ